MTVRPVALPQYSTGGDGTSRGLGPGGSGDVWNDETYPESTTPAHCYGTSER